MSATKKADK
uniref:Putative regulatory peptide n=1 Tax=Bordetella bronchiseptica TaxID=518 RepID=Q0VJ72_BORBO|nr:putative regulatory peptide [Bordetella bronchiseptica]